MGIPGFEAMPLPDFAPGGPNQIAPRPAAGRPEMQPYLPPEVSQDPSGPDVTMNDPGFGGGPGFTKPSAGGGVTADQAMSWLNSRPGGMPKWAADRGMEPEKYAAFVAGNPESIGARQAARFAGGGATPAPQVMTKPAVQPLTAGGDGGSPGAAVRPAPLQTSVSEGASVTGGPRSYAASGGANVRGGMAPPGGLQALLAQAVSGRGPRPQGQMGTVAAPKRRVVRGGGKKIVA